jgi:hypothetical protein
MTGVLALALALCLNALQVQELVHDHGSEEGFAQCLTCQNFGESLLHSLPVVPTAAAAVAPFSAGPVLAPDLADPFRFPARGPPTLS